ncbi:MAG TPA: hypothetical protein VN761_07725 [Candidatus Polarisedimenticolia bacterium]|nr:hypothetical protein [Candidatus Polarisedimenticolia bacterium]
MVQIGELNGHFHASFAGLPNASYTIQYASSLEGPWKTLASVTADNSGYFELDDPAEPLAGNRFYRVAKTP